jgi:hypothetical protein
MPDSTKRKKKTKDKYVNDTMKEKNRYTDNHRRCFSIAALVISRYQPATSTDSSRD